MIVTLDTLRRIAGAPIGVGNAESFLAGLEQLGCECGLDRPHRLAHYVAQVMHESLRFVYDRELWGPTPAQERYDTRTDLGNTPEVDGDGFLYRGRGPIQITGRANYARFRDWCRVRGLAPPDFVAEPDAVRTDPWEGIGPLWYWHAGNPDGRSLNHYADQGDAEMVTRRINGGLNGYGDRLRYLTRASLVFLGRGPDDVRAFQRHAGLVVDGIPGPRTRAALHSALTAQRPLDLTA